MKKDSSRWTDNPFRDPNISPKQQEWLDKRDEAMRIYRETGDPSMAQEIGLFPKDEAKEADDDKGA